VKLAHRTVLIVGHADADGHLAAEQSRRNGLAAGAKTCDVFIHPTYTAGHRMWQTHLDKIPLDGSDVVIFVDLMFRRDDIAGSVGALIDLVRSLPESTFMVIDHHPVGGLPALPENLSILLTPAVYTCCFGPPSHLMVVASICDNDEAPVAAMIDQTARQRALGMTRAAADRNLVGAPLLRLLSGERWDLIERMAEEPAEIHRQVRGRRTAKQPASSALADARIATAY